MTNRKGTPGDLEELEPIPVEALDTVDLSLPDEFSLDIFASELLEHLTTYQKLALAVKAARHSEDHQRAEQLSKQMLYNRMAAALIQQQYPGAKAIADTLARLRARQAAENRLALLQ